MEVLKIATAGSVDDGKSTLIGRLLYDTHSLTVDKLEAIEKTSRKNGLDYLDFSLATDGLVAEREQGITIDVAHIYFSTKKRSYIIADTPGHVEYTRNMVTGASTSQASMILIDARKGVIEQTYRHFFINNLLRIKEIIIAINKMDLVNYSEEVYDKIVLDLQELQAKSSFKNQNVTFIPVSALCGENIAKKSSTMAWYKGQSVLEHLENLSVENFQEKSEARFAVQTVIRPKTKEYHDFRGYAGKVAGGSLRVGDEVTVLPSLNTSKIKGIYFFGKEYEQAPAGNSVTITLTDDINIARGNMLVKSSEVPEQTRNIKATICWMDNKALVPGSKYLLQHNTNRVLARIMGMDASSIANFQGDSEDGSLKLNGLGQVSLKLSKPVCIDKYEHNQSNGRFILIDLQSNTTAGVGFIE